MKSKQPKISVLGIGNRKSNTYLPSETLLSGLFQLYITRLSTISTQEVPKPNLKPRFYS